MNRTSPNTVFTHRVGIRRPSIRPRDFDEANQAVVNTGTLYEITANKCAKVNLGGKIITHIYMVRHGESPKAGGNERFRGLTDKGKMDAGRITELLRDEGIDEFFSSPYSRAVLTIENLAKAAGKKVQIHEDLKEVVFSSDDKIMPDNELYPLVTKMFSDRKIPSPGGETIMECQTRAVSVLKEILRKYSGQRIVIGSHGAVMKLMMEHFDSKYDFEFLMKTSKPDVYKMKFDNEELIDVQRLWIE